MNNISFFTVTIDVINVPEAGIDTLGVINVINTLEVEVTNDIPTLLPNIVSLRYLVIIHFFKADIIHLVSEDTANKYSQLIVC